MKKLIVLSGVDGTGKSTLSEIIEKYYSKKKLKVKYYHGHTYSLSKKSLGLSPKKVKSYSFLLRFLWPIALLDNYYTYFFIYKKFLKNYDVVISDRYFYDKVVRLMFYNIIPNSIGRIYIKILPKPTNLFILDATTDVIIKRKKEYSKKNLIKFKKLYALLAKTVNKKIINTNTSINSNKKTILKVLREEKK